MIMKAEVKKLVFQLGRIIKTEVKIGKDFDSIATSDNIKRVFKDFELDVDANGTGDSRSTTYMYNIGSYGGRVHRGNLNKDDVDGFGCKRLEVKDAYIDISIEYGEKNKIEIDLSCKVDWVDRYNNWHVEYPHLQNWVILDGLYEDCPIEERYIEKPALYEDFKGRLVVLNDKTYKEDYRSVENLIVRATNGNGCSSTAIGRKVFYQCPYDNDNSHTDRNNIRFIIKKEYEEEVIKRYCQSKNNEEVV